MKRVLFFLLMIFVSFGVIADCEIQAKDHDCFTIFAKGTIFSAFPVPFQSPDVLKALRHGKSGGIFSCPEVFPLSWQIHGVPFPESAAELPVTVSPGPWRRSSRFRNGFRNLYRGARGIQNLQADRDMLSIQASVNFRPAFGCLTHLQAGGDLLCPTMAFLISSLRSE